MMTMCDDEKKLKIIARAVKTSVRKKKKRDRVRPHGEKDPAYA